MTSLHDYIRPLETEEFSYLLLDSFDAGLKLVDKGRLQDHMVLRSYQELEMNRQEEVEVLREDSHQALEGYRIFGVIGALGDD